MKDGRRMTTKGHWIIATPALALVGLLNSADALTIRAGYPQQRAIEMAAKRRICEITSLASRSIQ